MLHYHLQTVSVESFRFQLVAIICPRFSCTHPEEIVLEKSLEDREDKLNKDN